MTVKIDVPLPPITKKADLRAVQTLALYAQGAATPYAPGEEPAPPTPHDCKRVLDWIITEVSRYYDNGHFVNDPGGRNAAFIDGRQYVAKQIVMAMQLRPELLPE